MADINDNALGGGKSAIEKAHRVLGEQIAEASRV
jgi:hypothetical protein